MDEDQRKLNGRRFGWLVIGSLTLLWLLGGILWLQSLLATDSIYRRLSRLLPGVLGNPASLDSESFGSGLLEYPHYTRPAQWQGMAVPEVLLSGHHQKIERWRCKQALRRTRTRRPELLKQLELTEEVRELLAELEAECNQD